MNRNRKLAASFRLERHSRKCSVCNSPDRGAIEQGLRHWRSPAHLSRAYQPSPDSIYRHARALQFYPRRYPHFRSARELGRWAADTNGASQVSGTQGSRVDGKSSSGDQSSLGDHSLIDNLIAEARN
jgi:hypothetical protein